MVFINKKPKLSCHMESMLINDRCLIKPAMFICFCSAKFLLKGVNIVPFSNDHNIVSSLVCGGQNKHPMELLDFFLQIKKGCKDQESIQSSTTPDPGYQWESDKLTADTTNKGQEVSPFPAGDHKAHINRCAQRQKNTRQNKNIKDPQKMYRLGTVSKIFYWRA